MPEHMSDKYYEEKFEFPLWKLIRERAEDKDISYAAAAEQIVPEYIKTIKYRDIKFEEAAIHKRVQELTELSKNTQ